MSEYGIGRVPADVDPVSEAVAAMSAARHMPKAEVIECPNCGRHCYRTSLMDGVCPDCWHDDNDGDGYGR